MNEAPAATDLRCSTWTRDNSVDPIGTAGSYAGFVLFEWPLPWPHDVSEIAEIEPVAAVARAAGHRLQAVTGGRGAAAAPGSVLRHRLAMVYRWDPATGRFRGRQAELAADGVAMASALAAWIDGREPAGTADTTAIDVLLCGHGRRDRCCGSRGANLEIELRAAWGDRADVRLWRTSHTGGHRFAPTAVVLPEGTMWGYLDRDAVEAVLARLQPASERLTHYRGCAGLRSPRIQAVEREVLATEGWGILDQARDGTEGEDGSVRLTVGSGAARREWEAKVSVRRTLPVPDCGSPITAARKTEDELEVTKCRQVAGPPG